MNFTLLLQSFRTAFRRPRFFLVVVAVVALSLGLAVAAASLAYEVKFRPLRYADAGRLHVLNSVNRTDGWWEAPGSIAEFKRYEQNAHQDAGMAVFYDQETLTLAATSATEQAERVPVTFAEHNFFSLLGVALALGRTFSAEETSQGSSHPIAVVSHEFWRAKLGGRADVLGHVLWRISFWSMASVGPGLGRHDHRHRRFRGGVHSCLARFARGSIDGVAERVRRRDVFGVRYRSRSRASVAPSASEGNRPPACSYTNLCPARSSTAFAAGSMPDFTRT